MPDQSGKGMQCNEFDLLLSDALDGVLTGNELDRFQAHARICRTCGPLLADAEAGRGWLKGLKEVEPPTNLVRNILASTTGVDTQRRHATVRVPQRISGLERVPASLFGYLEPIFVAIRQPRFAMSFGMAFFALSVGLTIAGVKPADLRQVSLRPAMIRRTYYSTQARVVRYYDNIRFVYEVESRLREFKRNVEPAEPGLRKPKERKNDTTQQPQPKQERNYSQTDSRLILASAPLDPSVFDRLKLDRSNFDPSNPDLPVVSVTTYRRFV
jgi:hypothetical protein